MEYPIRVLVLDTVMDRGGAETMMMNYFRNIDRNKIVFDFLVNRDYKAAYEDEIKSLSPEEKKFVPCCLGFGFAAFQPQRLRLHEAERRMT